MRSRFEVSKDTKYLIKFVIILVVANVWLVILYEPIQKLFGVSHEMSVIIGLGIGVLSGITIIRYFGSVKI